MANKIIVAGVGMSPFSRPSMRQHYPEMASTAVAAALADAAIDFDDLQRAYVGYVYGDSTAGQRALYPCGMTGIPIVNVNNNCATGSTALFLAIDAVRHGAAYCVLALGFEQMAPGALSVIFEDRENPLGPHLDAMDAQCGRTDAPFAAQMFGGAGREHMALHGTRAETFARIAVKARKHAAHNPFAVFRDQVTLDEVLASPNIFDPLTRLQCCPPTNGAAAAVIMSEAFARRRGIMNGVAVRAQSFTTDHPDALEGRSAIDLVGAGMTRRAAAEVYDESGVTPEDIDVVELHDCFTANELISYEALGLTPDGTAERFILDGENSYGGQVVTNPSGGLLSKGHPLGATGIAQCAELVWQLRHVAGARQVEGARLALQHNLGLGGACVITLYERMS